MKHPNNLYRYVYGKTVTISDTVPDLEDLDDGTEVGVYIFNKEMVVKKTAELADKE